MLPPRSIETSVRSIRCLPLGVLLVLAQRVSPQNQIWSSQLASDQSDSAHAAAPDAAGGVYVGGYTWGDLAAGSAGGEDVWVARFDGAGDPLWVRQLGTSEYEALYGAAPDGAGGAFVCGMTFGELGGPNAGADDAWVARYDGAGNLSWIRQFGNVNANAANTVASDGSSGVFVGGTTVGDDEDGWLARYDAAGNRSWIQPFAQRAVSASVPDGTGGVLVTGHGSGPFGQTDPWVARYDGAGNELWLRIPGTQEHDWLDCAAPDGSGGVYALGSLGGGFDGTRIRPRVIRYDGAGNLLWERVLGTSGDVLRLLAGAADGSGGVYVGGQTYSTEVAEVPWLAHLDGAGNLLWLLVELGEGSLNAAATDDAGGVYFAGDDGLPEQDVRLTRYAAVCGPASATLRNSGPNPDSLRTSTPVLGSPFSAEVDLASTGHTLAVLYAMDGAVDITRPGGQHVLCANLYGHGLLYRASGSGPLATFSLQLPDDLTLCGLRLSMQAIHIGTVVPFALSNAVDLVIGN